MLLWALRGVCKREIESERGGGSSREKRQSMCVHELRIPRSFVECGLEFGQLGSLLLSVAFMLSLMMIVCV